MYEFFSLNKKKAWEKSFFSEHLRLLIHIYFKQSRKYDMKSYFCTEFIAGSKTVSEKIYLQSFLTGRHFCVGPFTINTNFSDKQIIFEQPILK